LICALKLLSAINILQASDTVNIQMDDDFDILMAMIDLDDFNDGECSDADSVAAFSARRTNILPTTKQ